MEEILLRNCAHSAVGSTATKLGYVIKSDSVSITYAKTPIQVPIPQNDPQIIDLGIYRPALTISGLVDTVGGDPSNTNAGVQGLAGIPITRIAGYGSNANPKTYYFPTKNVLESFCKEQVFTKASPLEVEIGDASFPVYASSTQATGGAIYEVALQQFRVQLDATKEDRYQVSMQFVVGARKDS